MPYYVVDRLQHALKREAIALGDARLTFVGFRMVPGDTFKVLADLRFEHGGRTETLSPGMLATQHGEVPFSVMLPGIGPTSVAGMDADHGRVALVLPNEGGVTQRVALFELRLRPGLPLAWFGALVAVVLGLATIATALARPAVTIPR